VQQQLTVPNDWSSLWLAAGGMVDAISPSLVAEQRCCRGCHCCNRCCHRRGSYDLIGRVYASGAMGVPLALHVLSGDAGERVVYGDSRGAAVLLLCGSRELPARDLISTETHKVGGRGESGLLWTAVARVDAPAAAAEACAAALGGRTPQTLHEPAAVALCEWPPLPHQHWTHTRDNKQWALCLGVCRTTSTCMRSTRTGSPRSSGFLSWAW
jgi:hypothetical protein